jgi:hypothetical protein
MRRQRRRFSLFAFTSPPAGLRAWRRNGISNFLFGSLNQLQLLA